MTIADKIKLLDDVLFSNYDIEYIAAELQATNPEKFRIIISTLLESENITEEEFHRLNSEIDIDDKVDLICRNQLMSRYELQREIYGMDIETETELELLYDEEDDIEAYDDLLEECNNVDENKINNIYEISGAYQTTCDNTCLFEVLKVVTSNPELLNYIPYSHAQLLGIDSLVAKCNDQRDDNRMFIEIVETLPVDYLTYCDFYGLCENEVDNVKLKLANKIDLYLEEVITSYRKI